MTAFGRLKHTPHMRIFGLQLVFTWCFSPWAPLRVKREITGQFTKKQIAYGCIASINGKE